MDRVSKLDEVIFDLSQNKVVTGELRYLAELLENMFNSYNLNVLLKSCRLLSLLILRFKNSLYPYLEKLKPAILKSLSSRKAVYQVEISKVFYYLSKYCFSTEEYVTFLLTGMGSTSWASTMKFLTEIFVTLLESKSVEISMLSGKNHFINTVESRLKHPTFAMKAYASIILIQCKQVYPEDFETLLSPLLQAHLEKLNGDKLEQHK